MIYFKRTTAQGLEPYSDRIGFTIEGGMIYLLQVYLKDGISAWSESIMSRIFDSLCVLESGRLRDLLATRREHAEIPQALNIFIRINTSVKILFRKRGFAFYSGKRSILSIKNEGKRCLRLK